MEDEDEDVWGGGKEERKAIVLELVLSSIMRMR